MAFAGNVKLTDIPELSERADILCIGKEIVDAPAAGLEAGCDEGGVLKHGIEPAGKTELWVNEITLANANLSDMADAVAEQLGLDKGKVMVVDVRPRHITFDVLERNVPQAGIMGKERAILSALAALPGVCLTDKSYIHSNGILGLICADVEEPEAVLDRVSNMTREIQEKVSRRAIVFPTGFELKQGMIQDTNTPFLKHELEERGYYVTVGEVMEDNVEDVVEKLDDALSRGFGLIVTTGGVGAEDKTTR